MLFRVSPKNVLLFSTQKLGTSNHIQKLLKLQLQTRVAHYQTLVDNYDELPTYIQLCHVSLLIGVLQRGVLQVEYPLCHTVIVEWLQWPQSFHYSH